MRDRSQRASHCGWVSDGDPCLKRADFDETGSPLVGTLRERTAAVHKRRIERDRAEDVTGSSQS